jgi:hypothetical protein
MNSHSYETEVSSRESLPPTMLEVLGDHLFCKVQELCPSVVSVRDSNCEVDVAKITGVLLELGEVKVMYNTLNKPLSIICTLVPNFLIEKCW